MQNRAPYQLTGATVDWAALLRCRHLAANLLWANTPIGHCAHVGYHRSVLKGRGMEFSEVRLYQSGDEIKHMDWRVTARTGKPHTKLFEEEKSRDVYVLIDFRQGMYFGTKCAFKTVIAAQLVALIGWAAVAAHDKLGGWLLSDNKQQEIKPRKHQKHLLQLFKQMIQIEPMETTTDGFITIAKRLRQVVRPGSLLFFISDFYDPMEPLIPTLRSLATHNQLIFAWVYDAIERCPPPPGWYSITNGRQWYAFNTQDSSFRQHYIQQFKDRYEALKQLGQAMQIPLWSFPTHEPVYERLLGYLRGVPHEFS